MARERRSIFVPTPTNAGNPNPVETHFRTIRRWVLPQTNYMDSSEASEAFRLTIRQLNRVHCVTNSRPAPLWWTWHKHR